MTDFHRLAAAETNFHFDYMKMDQELLTIPDAYWAHHTHTNRGCATTGLQVNKQQVWKDRTVWLRTNNIIPNPSGFREAKLVDHAHWYWDERFDIPYIKSVIESLPTVGPIGCIRGADLVDAMPFHTDINDAKSNELTYNLGIWISFNDAHLSIRDSNQQEILVKTKVALLNDNFPHGYPDAANQRGIRIFGNFNLTEIEKHITQAYYY